MFQFKELTASTKYLSYKSWAIGGYVIGTVKMFRPNAKNPKNQDVIVDVIDSNLKSDKTVIAKGDAFTINGTTALQKTLGAVEEGDIIKVTYLGQEEVKSGQWKGTKANKLKVEVAAAQDKHQFESASTNEDSDDLV